MELKYSQYILPVSGEWKNVGRESLGNYTLDSCRFQTNDDAVDDALRTLRDQTPLWAALSSSPRHICSSPVASGLCFLIQRQRKETSLPSCRTSRWHRDGSREEAASAPRAEASRAAPSSSRWREEDELIPRSRRRRQKEGGGGNPAREQESDSHIHIRSRERRKSEPPHVRCARVGEKGLIVNLKENYVYFYLSFFPTQKENLQAKVRNTKHVLFSPVGIKMDYNCSWRELTPVSIHDWLINYICGR